MKYQLLLTRSAEKDLRKIRKGSAPDFKRILQALQDIERDPYQHPQTKALQGRAEDRRYRVGGYRILYSVTEQTITVEVFRIGTRGDVYKSLN